MFSTRTLSLSEANSLIDSARRAAAAEPGSPPVACAIVGSSGELIAFAADDGTAPLPRRLAARKAITALQLKRDTHDVRELVGSGAIDLERLQDPDLIAIPGGTPIRIDGALVGAIGVSGLAPDDDAKIARTAANETVFGDLDSTASAGLR